MTGRLICESFRGTSLAIYWTCCDQDTGLASYMPIHVEWRNRPLVLSCIVMPGAAEPGVFVLEGTCDKECFRHTRALTADDVYKPQKIVLTRGCTSGDGFDVYLSRPALSDPEDTYKGPKQLGTSTANLAILELMVDLAEREATA